MSFYRMLVSNFSPFSRLGMVSRDGFILWGERSPKQFTGVMGGIFVGSIIITPLLLLTLPIYVGTFLKTLFVDYIPRRMNAADDKRITLAESAITGMSDQQMAQLVEALKSDPKSHGSRELIAKISTDDTFNAEKQAIERTNIETIEDYSKSPVQYEPSKAKYSNRGTLRSDSGLLDTDSYKEKLTEHIKEGRTIFKLDEARTHWQTYTPATPDHLGLKGSKELLKSYLIEGKNNGKATHTKIMSFFNINPPSIIEGEMQINDDGKATFIPNKS